MNTPFSSLLRVLGAALILPLLLAFPVAAESFTGADGVAVEIVKTDRVAALNASTVEIMQELGEAPRIVCVDNGGGRVLASAPPGTPAPAGGVTAVGHPYNPGIALVIASRPDVVITARENIKDAPLARLRAEGLPVVVLENSSLDGMDGLKRRITLLAGIFNKAEKGQELIRRLDDQTKALKAEIPAGGSKPRVLFLYPQEGGKALIYGKGTGSHWLIDLAGAENAADFPEPHQPLTAESMKRLRPDAIIVLQRAAGGFGGVEGILRLPGVAASPAGKNRSIIVVDNNIRWIGPRFPAEVEKLRAALRPPALP